MCTVPWREVHRLTYRRNDDTYLNNTEQKRGEAARRNTGAARRVNNAVQRGSKAGGGTQASPKRVQSTQKLPAQSAQRRAHVSQRAAIQYNNAARNNNAARRSASQTSAPKPDVREADTKKGRKKSLLRRLGPWLIAAAVLAAVSVGGYFAYEYTPLGAMAESFFLNFEMPDWIKVDLIPVDGTSRRGVKLETRVKDIVIHYVGNPQTSAAANRNWYTNSKSTVSSHFIVGLEGEVIQCVPLDEKSSASNERNRDTISIETCHPDETGKFSTVTYNSLVRLTAWLCDRYNLSTDHIIRHYDVTGKDCPKYFVEHEDAWKQFRQDVQNYIDSNY